MRQRSYDGYVNAVFNFTFASTSPFGSTTLMTAQVGGDVNPFAASVAVYEQPASMAGNLNFNAVANVCCRGISATYACTYLLAAVVR
jgi:hypothetical protein